MTEKTKMQQIIADWKKLETENQKEVFLKKVQIEIGNKNGDELLAGIKSISELVRNLHEVVIPPTPETRPIEIYPANAEEARLIEALLSRMNVKYKVV